MEIKINSDEFKENFYKALAGLTEGNDVEYFSVEKDTKTIGLMFGQWNVKLYNDGKWEIF